MRGIARRGGFFALAFVVGACGSARDAPTWEDDTEVVAPGFALGEVPPPPTPCEGLACKRVHCANGSEARVSGRLLAPNGVTPIPGALVYVPTAEVEPLPAAASCGCGAPHVVAANRTAADGTFTLTGLPVGKGVPLVMQLGKWRRTVVLPEITACSDTTLDETTTRLPKNHDEGDMPKIAVTTGACDSLGCLLPKLGIDDGEIGVERDGDARSVHAFRGAMDAADVPEGASLAEKLWSDPKALARYDMILLACECGEQLARKGPVANQAMERYLDGGGRVLTTDYGFTWYRDMPSRALASVVKVRGGATEANNPVRISTDPAGRELASWFRAAVSSPAVENHVRFASVFDNLESVDPSRAEVLGVSASARSGGQEVARMLSIDFPVGATATCGRAVHVDAHVNDSKTIDAVGRGFPGSCRRGLDEAHAALAYLFFRLAACEVPLPSLPYPPPDPIR